MKKLIIIGASGHGKEVADIAKKNGYEDIRFLYDNEELTYCSGYPVIGKSTDFIKYSCDFIVAIGNNETRRNIQEQLEIEGKSITVLIHPSASVGENVSIGKGTVIMAGAVLNAASKIGKGCIINTCSSVDHDCCLEDYIHLAVGAHMSGTCRIGASTWIGTGAIIINNISICENAVIGAGAVVIRNIEEPGTYVGVPARMI